MRGYFSAHAIFMWKGEGRRGLKRVTRRKCTTRNTLLESAKLHRS
jgi:hypothetical protein